MATFLDNKGCGVVPRLSTLAIVNGGLQESDITCFDPTMIRKYREEIQRLRCRDQRYNYYPRIFLAKDLSAEMVCAPPINIVDDSLPKDGNSWSYSEPDTSTAIGRAAHHLETLHQLTVRQQHPPGQNWGAALEVFSVIANSLQYLSAVLVNAVRPGFHTVFFRRSEETKFVMVISPGLLKKLALGGFDLRPIRRLILVSELEGQWLSKMPDLNHLTIISRSCNLSHVLPLSGTLEELRIVVDTHDRADTFERALSQLSALRLLYVELQCYSYSVNWQLLQLSPRLRSLTLLGIAHASVADIIGFLTKEVNHNGKARQDLLDDFTVTEVDEGVMEEIYRSDALTERIKERIFCDISLEHLTSTLMLVSKKMDYNLAISLTLLFDKGRQLLRAGNIPQKNLVLVVLEVIRHTYRLNDCLLVGLPLLDSLLRRTQLTYSEGAFFVDTMVQVLLEDNTQNNIGINGTLAGLMFSQLHLRGFHPTNILKYLEAILDLIRYGKTYHRQVLPPIFVGYATTLPPHQLHAFYKRMKVYLSMICTFMICRGDVVHLDGRQYLHIFTAEQVSVQDSLLKMLKFIFQTTREEVLRISLNAVLRRSDSGPHEGTWHNNGTAEIERWLFLNLIRAEKVVFYV